jgi:hypothetical protein
MTSGGCQEPGATVVATRDQKRFTTTTNANGGYSFPDLPDGKSHLHVEMTCLASDNRDIVISKTSELISIRVTLDCS